MIWYEMEILAKNQTFGGLVEHLVTSDHPTK